MIQWSHAARPHRRARIRLAVPMLLALALACGLPSDPSAPQPRRLSPAFPLGRHGTLVLGQPPEGPGLRRMGPMEWPPYLFMRQPVHGVWTSTPDSLKGAWASLDEDGNVRCLMAEYGTSVGYRSLRSVLIGRFGPPTVDSTDGFGRYTLWVDPHTAWILAAGLGSETTGGALLSGILRAGGPDPRDPSFVYPCEPLPQ